MQQEVEHKLALIIKEIKETNKILKEVLDEN